MTPRARAAFVLLLALSVSACSSGGGGAPTGAPITSAPSLATDAPTDAATDVPSEAPSAEPSAPASEAASGSPTAGTTCENVAEGSTDLLATVCEAGVIRVSTDPNYAPQSFLNPDGTFEGFDIDVAEEIATRLGVEVRFETPSFDAVVAGGWQDRWDMSVGSVTITEPRLESLDFTQPYYYTPAQLAATEASGITEPAGLAGKVICVGSATTYQQWIEGTLELVEAPEPAPPPEGATAFPLETDQLCAQAVASGRTDFEGWLSSSTTVKAALDADTPMIPIGDPVFFEPLAVAFDKSQEANDELVAAVDAIVGEMHEDGTLSALSEQWFDGLDLTVTE